MGNIRSLFIRGPRKNKYKNHAVRIDSIRFASKGEGKRYLELREMKQKNEIKDFELQPEFILQPKYWKCCGEVTTNPNSKKHLCPYCGKPMPFERPIIYRADFRITHLDGHQTIEDVKGWGGFTTPEFKMKKKMFGFKFPELVLEIVQRSGKGMDIYAETVPKTEESDDA